MDFNFKIEPNEEVYFCLYGGVGVGKLTSFNFDLTVLDKKQNKYPQITYTNKGYESTVPIGYFTMLPINAIKKENLDYIDVYILLHLMQGYCSQQGMIFTLRELCSSLHIFNFNDEILKSKKKKQFNDKLKDKVYKAIVTMKPFADNIRDRFPDDRYEEFMKYYNSAIEV